MKKCMFNHCISLDLSISLKKNITIIDHLQYTKILCKKCLEVFKCNVLTHYFKRIIINYELTYNDIINYTPNVLTNYICIKISW